MSEYNASVVKDSDLVSLLCLLSIRQGPGVIHTGHDALYMPETPGSDIYRKLPLDFDGTGNLLPFDVMDDAPLEPYVCNQRVLEEYGGGAGRV